MSEESHGILETVLNSEQNAALRAFNPHAAVLKHLEKLDPREVQILNARYGLLDAEPQTLEVIGKKIGLTRERIRQIEKDALNKAQTIPFSPELEKAADLIFQIIEDHGNIIRETQLVQILIPGGGETQRQALLFTLHLVSKFNLLPETTQTYQSWYLVGFDKDVFNEVVDKAYQILSQEGKTLEARELFQKIRSSASEETSSLRIEAIESMIGASKKLAKNPYHEWGLDIWPEINPRDVGDKAYLVLKHHKKPEHYSKITELINKQKFNGRVAHKETVHNELIKDKRFVLIGRGIYALASWGYQPGVVADIIQDILRKAGRPFSKNEIIDQVLKQRMVKQNTIVVALSNRQRFQKTADNKYLNV